MNEKSLTESALIGEIIGELDVAYVVGIVDVLDLRFDWLVLVDDDDACSLVSPAFVAGLCSVSVKLKIIL